MSSATTDPTTAAPRSGPASRRRRLAVGARVVLAAVALFLALVVGYVRRAAVDSDQFANRSSVALKDESVRTLIATQVTDRVVLRNQADLVAARPLIESILSFRARLTAPIARDVSANPIFCS